MLVFVWYTLLYAHSSFATILKRKRAGGFASIVFRMSCYCKCPVALPHSAVGWSPVYVVPTYLFGFCLFGLILYVPSTIFQLYRDGSSWVEPVLS